MAGRLSLSLSLTLSWKRTKTLHPLGLTSKNTQLGIPKIRILLKQNNIFFTGLGQHFMVGPGYHRGPYVLRKKESWREIERERKKSPENHLSATSSIFVALLFSHQHQSVASNPSQDAPLLAFFGVDYPPLTSLSLSCPEIWCLGWRLSRSLTACERISIAIPLIYFATRWHFDLQEQKDQKDEGRRRQDAGYSRRRCLSAGSERTHHQDLLHFKKIKGRDVSKGLEREGHGF